MAHEPREDIPSAPDSSYRLMLTCASIVTFVCILIVSWLWTSSEEKLLYLLVILPVFLPYAFVPLRLYNRRIRSGLSLALAMGCALLIPGIYLLRFALRWDNRRWVLGSLILALSMQPVLVIISAKTLLSISPVSHGRAKILGSLTYGCLIFGLFWPFYSPVPRYIRDNERFAMKYLNDCAISTFLYADEHEGTLNTPNFASLAGALKPKCMTPNNPTHGYVFEYSGSSPSMTVQRSGFKSFAVTARPVAFGRTGVRSFLIDERLSIHATSLNRPANAIDPLDNTLLFEHRPQ